MKIGNLRIYVRTECNIYRWEKDDTSETTDLTSSVHVIKIHLYDTIRHLKNECLVEKEIEWYIHAGEWMFIELHL